MFISSYILTIFLLFFQLKILLALISRMGKIEYKDPNFKEEKFQKFARFGRRSSNSDFILLLNERYYLLHQEVVKQNAIFNSIFSSKSDEGQRSKSELVYSTTIIKSFEGDKVLRILSPGDKVAYEAFEDILDYWYTGRIVLDEKKCRTFIRLQIT